MELKIDPQTLVGLGVLITLIAGQIKILLEVKRTNKEVEKGNVITEKVKEGNDTIKILVDGRMTAALRTVARLARARANDTKDPEDIKAAEFAELELQKKYDQDDSVGIKRRDYGPNNS